MCTLGPYLCLASCRPYLASRASAGTCRRAGLSFSLRAHGTPPVHCSLAGGDVSPGARVVHVRPVVVVRDCSRVASRNNPYSVPILPSVSSFCLTPSVCFPPSVFCSFRPTARRSAFLCLPGSSSPAPPSSSLGWTASRMSTPRSTRQWAPGGTPPSDPIRIRCWATLVCAPRHLFIGGSPRWPARHAHDRGTSAAR